MLKDLRRFAALVVTFLLFGLFFAAMRHSQVVPSPSLQPTPTTIYPTPVPTITLHNTALALVAAESTPTATFVPIYPTPVPLPGGPKPALAKSSQATEEPLSSEVLLVGLLVVLVISVNGFAKLIRSPYA